MRGVAAAALCLAGLLPAAKAQQTAAPPSSLTAEQYRIGARDVLTIRVAAPDIVAQFSAEALEVNECGMIPLLSVQNEAAAGARAAAVV